MRVGSGQRATEPATPDQDLARQMTEHHLVIGPGVVGVILEAVALEVLDDVDNAVCL